MSETLPPCPECSSEYTYAMDSLLVCPECAHEWNAHIAGEGGNNAAGAEIKDAVGNVLQDGDSVTIVKTMKVKGAQAALKSGTKVRNIRLTPGSGDHDIFAKVDGFGPMELKSSIVKKA
ncbi:phosphonoacetate hydrolase [Arthrobacter sp. MYb229]|uniref:zinc ribbon domain-containing protein YjdM n=1 Tax=Micrococcaceae TaxID=1268 RepID=UPI000BB740A6|nr:MULTISPECIES: zinc ribbon domain-containing protein YjdM [Micrococcaceae]PCC28891.1 phosphonoacetate hydrolase [Glutamicibacter sp. BW80]PRA03116.1 phosphonoacetate hydrolase [Arthrobacter sp. MYb229]PRB49587.1 phosphonoacetate hydrolase [Arthrobacter sp. MYb216]